MTEGKGSKEQTTIYKTRHRKLTIELHDLLYHTIYYITRFIISHDLLYLNVWQLVDNYSLQICRK
jgi:hypothetical protein